MARRRKQEDQEFANTDPMAVDESGEFINKDTNISTESDTSGEVQYDHVPSEVEEAVEAPQEQSQEEPGSTETVIEWPVHLLKEAGITAEEAATQFGSPESLALAVEKLDQNYFELARQYRPTQQWQTPVQQQPYPYAWQGTMPAGPQHPLAGWPNTTIPQTQYIPPAQLPYQPQYVPPYQPQYTSQTAPTVNMEGWDEDTKQLVTTILESQRAELARRDAEIAQTRQFMERIAWEREREQAANYIAEVDAFCNALIEEDPGYAPLLGSGPGLGMDPGSLQSQNRAMLDGVAAQLNLGRRMSGLPELDRMDALARAVPLAFPNQYRNAVVAEVQSDIQQKVDERSALLTQRPTRRQRSPKTPLEKASATAIEWYRRMGYEVDDTTFEQEIV